MRTRSITYAVATFGQLAALAGTTLLSRLLVRLGAGRAAPTDSAA